MSNLTIRPATVYDAEICYRIKQGALKTYVDTIWGWDETDQHKSHRENFTPEDISIISYNTTTIGYCELEETEDHFFLKNLLIQEKYRNLGIGSFVLEKLIKNAKAHQKSITLQVFKTNIKAQKLYREHGFIVNGIKDHHFKMIRDF